MNILLLNSTTLATHHTCQEAVYRLPASNNSSTNLTHLVMAKRHSDGYVPWDNLDLDALLGEYTDMEMSGNNSSEESEDDEISQPLPPSPATGKPKSSANYTCPLCSKVYRSITGFRGHTRKFHGRPDIRGKSMILRCYSQDGCMMLWH